MPKCCMYMLKTLCKHLEVLVYLVINQKTVCPACKNTIFAITSLLDRHFTWFSSETFGRIFPLIIYITNSVFNDVVPRKHVLVFDIFQGTFAGPFEGRHFDFVLSYRLAHVCNFVSEKEIKNTNKKKGGVHNSYKVPCKTLFFTFLLLIFLQSSNAFLY